MKLAMRSGATMAAAAAVMMLSGALAAPAAYADEAKGHCMGANACKGQGACKTTSNACKGQNACKGKGFAEMTSADCAKAGGTMEKKG